MQEVQGPSAEFQGRNIQAIDDHVYMTLEFELKFEIIKNLNPSFIRLEKLKINKIVNLMNRRAKNLLLKQNNDMDKYDYLVQIFNNIEKNILNFKYRINDSIEYS